jgi:hypothetical protein
MTKLLFHDRIYESNFWEAISVPPVLILQGENTTIKNAERSMVYPPDLDGLVQ